MGLIAEVFDFFSIIYNQLLLSSNQSKVLHRLSYQLFESEIALGSAQFQVL